VPEADTRDVDHGSAPLFPAVLMSIHALTGRGERKLRLS
jgi:hypothetical protein